MFKKNVISFHIIEWDNIFKKPKQMYCTFDCDYTFLLSQRVMLEKNEQLRFVRAAPLFVRVGRAWCTLENFFQFEFPDTRFVTSSTSSSMLTYCLFQCTSCWQFKTDNCFICFVTLFVYSIVRNSNLKIALKHYKW